MKNFILAVLISCAAFARADEHHHADAAKQLYTCGMHPQVVQDHPGNCPICGMKLTPIRKQGGQTAAASGGRKVKYYKSTMNLGETRGVRSLTTFLGKTNYAEEAARLGIGARLEKARKLLDAVKLPEYLQTLRGTIGAQPLGPLTTGT